MRCWGAERRRLPRRARADDHGDRPAVDHPRPRVERPASLPSPSSATPRGSSTATCSRTSSRCRWRAAWPTSGARGGCSWPRSIVFIARRRCSPGRAQTIDELIAGRIVQGIGGGILVPVGTAAASHLFEGHDRPRALGVIGALTFLGMAAGPFLGAAILGGSNVEGALESLGARARTRAPRPVRAVVAAGSSTSTSRSGSSPSSIAWAASSRLGDAAPARRRSTSSARSSGRVALGGGLGRGDADRRARTSAGSTRSSSSAVAGGRRRPSATLATIVRGLRRPDPVPRPAPVQEPDVRVGGARLAADRLRVRDRDHRRGGVRRSRPLRRPRASSGSRWARSRPRRPSGRSSRGFAVRVPVAPARDARRAARSARALLVVMSRWTPARRARRGRARAGGLRGSGSG